MRRYGPPWNDEAQFCKNGHFITGYAASEPERKQRFCQTCGAETICACPKCGTKFEGAVHNAAIAGRPVAAFTRSTTPPPFCRECGLALPWTAQRLQAADLADLQQGLTDDEKVLLKKSLDDLIRDTPQTTVAAHRLKQIGAKAGKSALEGFRTILIDVVSETAKKILFPSP